MIFKLGVTLLIPLILLTVVLWIEAGSQSVYEQLFGVMPTSQAIIIGLWLLCGLSSLIMLFIGLLQWALS